MKLKKPVKLVKSKRERLPVSNVVSSAPLLEVKGLKKHFPIRKGFLKRTVGFVKAVDDVSFNIKAGETVGLVGESGCGKTTLGRMLLRAIEPTEGQVLLKLPEGKVVDLPTLDAKTLRSLRPHTAMIFQDPYASLNPRMTVLDIVGEPLVISRRAKGRELEERVKYLMSVVGLEIKHLKRYPHAFSGGQRQRIGIARALATNPSFIVADEAVSALDVSIQAQVLNLLQDLQEQFHLTYLFISHALGVVEHISERVMVMYLGNVVESAKTEDLFREPLHPYTAALLASAPKPDPRKRDIVQLQGEVPNPAKPPPGCHFHPRCAFAKDVCKLEKPLLRDVNGRLAACHFAGELELKKIVS
jgi:peptide/nickel transport system ATP-binding protein